MILTLKETRNSIIPTRLHHNPKQPSLTQSQKPKATASDLFQKESKRPIIFLTTEGIIQFASLYNSYLYGLSYLFNSAFVIVFGPEGHGFGTIDLVFASSVSVLGFQSAQSPTP